MTDVPTPQFVLLAAGRSSRYGRPKQIDPLGPTGGSILAYTIVDVLRSGFREVIIVTTRELVAALEKHLRYVLGPDLPVRYAFQHLSDVPERLSHLAVLRDKPWGTGQAVLSARDHISGPFAVANADDWYGPEALEALAEQLTNDARELAEARSNAGAADTGVEGDDQSGGASAEGVNAPCVATALAYPMRATLSPNGGVSRGWIQADEEGAVGRVLEMTQVRSSASGGMVGIGPEGQVMPIPASTPASMNLWGFQPCILPLLEEGFTNFLFDEGSSDKAEYPLSTAVDELMSSGKLTLKVATRGRRWFGVTHPGDADAASRQLEALHRDGVYAKPLARTLG